MKSIRILLAATILVATGWVSNAHAQTLTVIYNFCSETNNGFCTDGDSPFSLITGTDGNLYGATSDGGSNNFGTIFTITPEGTFTTLLEGADTNRFPDLSLESGGLFYGTTLAGGSNRDGSIFTLTTAGTFTTLHQFSGTNGVADGAVPEHLVQGPGQTFYGTTLLGGSNNDGTAFSITSAGTFTTLHVFSGTNGIADGSTPVISFLSGGLLIGTTVTGGTFNAGTAFQMTTQGTLTTLHQFTGTNGVADGSGPVILSLKDGANFIGTTESGGISNAGTAFLMTDQGTVTTFYQFNGSNDVVLGGKTPDGDTPGLAPILDNAGAFYGGTQDGGTNEEGLIFTLTTSGTLSPVYEFCSSGAVTCLDGAAIGGFSFTVGADNNIYGVTAGGGANGGGTIFKLIPGAGVGGGGGSTNCSYALGSTNTMFTATGGASTVSVITSNSCAWTATNNVSFITITSGSSGSGDGTVSFSVAANGSANAQTGSMTIAGLTFTVVEAGTTNSSCSYAISPTNAVFASTGGSNSVSVTASNGCAWNATSNSGFITITSGSSGSGNGTVTYSVATNSAYARAGTMTIAGLTFTLNQGAAPCAVSPTTTNATFTAAGGSASVTVTANETNCPWTATSNAGSITITSGTNYTGSGTVDYTVSANASSNQVIGTMTIAGQTFTVTQSGVGCSFLLGATGASFDADGGSGTLTVTASATNCTWGAVSDSAFIAITSGGGTGNGTVSYTVAANTGPSRSGMMTVAGQTFTIDQAEGSSQVSYSVTGAGQACKTKINKKADTTNTTCTVSFNLVVTNNGTTAAPKSSVLLWLGQGPDFSSTAGAPALTKKLGVLKTGRTATVKLKSKKLTGDQAGTFIFVTDTQDNILAFAEVPSP